MKSNYRLCGLAALLPIAAFANLPHAFSYGGRAFWNPTSAAYVEQFLEMLEGLGFFDPEEGQ